MSFIRTLVLLAAVLAAGGAAPEADAQEPGWRSRSRLEDRASRPRQRPRLEVRCVSCRSDAEARTAWRRAERELLADTAIMRYLSHVYSHRPAANLNQSGDRQRDAARLDGLFPPGAVAGTGYVTYRLSHTATQQGIYAALRNHGVAERHALTRAAVFHRLLRSTSMRGGAVFIMFAAGSAVLMEARERPDTGRRWGRYLLICGAAGVVGLVLYGAARHAGVLE